MLQTDHERRGAALRDGALGDHRNLPLGRFIRGLLLSSRKKGLGQVSISLEEALEPSEEGGQQKDFGCKDQILSGSIDRLVLERAIENLPPRLSHYLRAARCRRI